MSSTNSRTGQRPSLQLCTARSGKQGDSLDLSQPIGSFVSEPQIEPRRDQQFQIIGVLNRLYVLMENSDGLVLVDQHAAHERILFEELRRRMEEQGVPSQRILLPQIFSLPPRDAEWVERNVATLQKMGIGIENFGANSFRVDTLPAFLEIADAAEFLRKVIDELKTTSRSSSPLRLGEDMIAKTVCRHAVKANDPLRYPEIEKLIHDLLACDLPYCCPHGRSDHDPNFPRRIGKEIRAKSLEDDKQVNLKASSNWTVDGVARLHDSSNRRHRNQRSNLGGVTRFLLVVAAAKVFFEPDVQADKKVTATHFLDFEFGGAGATIAPSNGITVQV